MERIIEEYKNINKNYKNSIKEGYKQFPLLRLFYGKQFILLHDIALKNKNNIKIIQLLNSMAFNKIKNFNSYYKYKNNIGNIENINNYLENLFEINRIDLNEIYNKNKVKKDSYLYPGLYRKVKVGDNSDLSDNISPIPIFILLK